MDFSVLSTAVQTALGTHLPSILGAVGVLIVGYIAAVAARAAVCTLLSMLKLNQWVSKSVDRPMDIEGSVGLSAFWFILLVTLVGVFNTLNMNQVSGPFAEMMSQIMVYVPHLLAGVILLLVAWLVATMVKAIANRALKASQWDEKLTERAGMSAMSDNVGLILFWLVILMFLPAILGVLQLDGMLGPVRNMVNETLVMLPNIFAAGVILLAGWVVAKILRSLVSNLLATLGADKLGQSAGLKDALELSKLAGVLVFILVFVPALIASLDALKITSISGPATNMLNMMLTAIPNIFAAVLILSVTWYVSRFAAGLLGRLLANVGADGLPAKMGVAHVFTAGLAPSVLAPRIMLFFAMLFATVEASHRLNFTQVEQLVAKFVDFGGQVLLGATILIVGFWLATLVHQAIVRASGERALVMAGIARYTVLGLVLAMGLSAMGIAAEIVNMAFALVFGSVAVAVALSFGLGGREAAGRQMEHWLAKLRKE